jgi:hypothetical protein
MQKRNNKKSPLKDPGTGLPYITDEKPDKTMDLPSQKDLEKEISDYLSEKYGGRIRVVSQMVFPWQAKPDSTGRKERTDSEKGPKIRFNLKPEELEAYLSRYVVKQDMAKAILATKICTHFYLKTLKTDLAHQGQLEWAKLSRSKVYY